MSGPGREREEARAIARRATRIGIAGNAALLCLLAPLGLLSASLIVIGQAVDSTVDLLASVVVLIGVRVATQQADADHPFGHARAEPLASFVVAILGGVLALEVMKSAIEAFLGGAHVALGLFSTAALGFKALLKAGMALLLLGAVRRTGSPALRATAVDCRNDALLGAGSIAGAAGVAAGHSALDPILGFVLGAWVLRSAVGVALDNVDFLMGKTPEPDIVLAIGKAACGVAGVRAIRGVRAHHVGSSVQVEVTILVDGSLPTRDSHEIAEAARAALVALPAIDEAFIHVEPAPE